MILIRKRLSEHQLTLCEVLLLGILFFGVPSYFSIQVFFDTLGNNGTQGYDWTTLKVSENWMTIGYELVVLFLTVLYLRRIHFDLSSFDLSWSKMTLPLVLFLFVIAALVSDLGTLLSSLAFLPEIETEGVETGQVSLSLFLSKISVTWIIFAILNGFFEEIYFMGIVFLTEKKHLKHAIAFSLLLRFLFHTYQGIPAAIGVLCMGIVFLWFRFRIKSLLPFTLTHMLFDIFGLGLMHWVLISK